MAKSRMNEWMLCFSPVREIADAANTVFKHERIRAKPAVSAFLLLGKFIRHSVL
jgi:hypothetical protein